MSSTAPLSPEREAQIRKWGRTEAMTNEGMIANQYLGDLLRELDRMREERKVVREALEAVDALGKHWATCPVYPCSENHKAATAPGSRYLRPALEKCRTALDTMAEAETADGEPCDGNGRIFPELP